MEDITPSRNFFLNLRAPVSPQFVQIFSRPNTNMGNQKQAREERLKREIRRYIRSNPECTASQIVASLEY